MHMKTGGRARWGCHHSADGSEARRTGLAVGLSTLSSSPCSCGSGRRHCELHAEEEQLMQQSHSRPGVECTCIH